MGRVLTAARATVAPAQRGDYLAALGELARRREARNGHLWVFEQEGAEGAFLEFREGRLEAEPAGAEEAELEARLGTLAAYAPGHDIRWLEVPLPSHPGE